MQTLKTDALARIIAEVIEPQAAAVDRDGVFPRASIDALGEIGLLGLVSAEEVGGMGQALRAAAMAVEHVGKACASTGMVLCMHYTATKVIEGYGPRAVREAIAAGRHLTTVALSEAGSRSHFWAPLSTAKEQGNDVRLDADKSWVTSAGQVDSHVWSSRPLVAEGLSTLWLVPGKADGLSYPVKFDGLGLRGNSSSPIKAEGVLVPRESMLGADGQGYEIMVGDMNTYFLTLSSACNLGIMEAATGKTAAHVTAAQLSHLGQSLADLPTIRAYIARMRIKTDLVRALLGETITAQEAGREDASRLLLEIKAAAGESATEVTDLAMRVCGGAAFRKDVGVERHFRDARAATVMSPTTDLIYDAVGRIACGLPPS